LARCVIAAITVRKGTLDATSQIVGIWSVLTRTAGHACERTALGRVGGEVVTARTSRASS